MQLGWDNKGNSVVCSECMEGERVLFRREHGVGLEKAPRAKQGREQGEASSRSQGVALGLPDNGNKE